MTVKSQGPAVILGSCHQLLNIFRDGHFASLGTPIVFHEEWTTNLSKSSTSAAPEEEFVK